MSIKRYELTEEQWLQIKELIPTAKTGLPPKEHRLMLNAKIWLAKSRAGWEDLPERYGPWKSVYSRFCKWRNDGILEKIFLSLTKYADYENLSIDCTIIKAHQHSSGAKKRYKCLQ